MTEETDKLKTCRHGEGGVWRGDYPPWPWRGFDPRGREFLTCGIRSWETDKLKTCRHGEKEKTRTSYKLAATRRGKRYRQVENLPPRGGRGNLVD